MFHFRVWVGILIASAVLFWGSAPAWAEQDGGDIVFQDTKKMPHVTFQHSKHLAAGNQCSDCHPAIFQKKRGAADAAGDLTMKSIKKGRYCGACHDGVKAFKASRGCKKCHRPSE